MPGERKFLVGVRTFGQGDVFPLMYNGKTLRVQVMQVSPKQITFKNVETGETGALKLDMLPPGMIAGGGGNSRPPGMISNSDEVPLNLGSSNP